MRLDFSLKVTLFALRLSRQVCRSPRLTDRSFSFQTNETRAGKKSRDLPA